MQGCQLLDLLFGQALESGIGRMDGELHLGVSEPMA